MRLTTTEPSEHHLTIPPRHSPLRIGTLSGILSDVAAHLKITRDQIAQRLFS